MSRKNNYRPGTYFTGLHNGIPVTVPQFQDDMYAKELSDNEVYRMNYDKIFGTKEKKDENDSGRGT